MATYPIRQLADNGGTAQFVPVTAPEAVQFPDGSNLNTLIGSIATIESNPVAANHAAGEFLCINGQVYEVIDAIAAGDSIALGENVQAANLGSQITALNNGLWDWETFQGTVGGVAQTFYRKRLGNVYIIFGSGTVNAPIGAGSTSQRQIVYSSKPFSTACGGAANFALTAQINSQVRYCTVNRDRVDAWIYNPSSETIATLTYNFIVIGTV